jgi:hypothetical protein
MINKIPFTVAVKTMLGLLGAVLIFHLLVILGVLPNDIVWGGQLQNRKQAQGMELISMAVVLTFMLVIGIKAGYVKSRMPTKAINFLLWLFVIFFSLNTVGNLLAQTMFETIVFTPLTFISAIFCLRIALEKTN